tara:strand:+ start:774 stop:998 length:225 start_codon:yes stop_codon:yes gene_type:complete
MGITIDINKAKEIYKSKIRTLRKIELEKLDVEFIKAQEQGDDVSNIVTEKQKLRNLPSQVDEAKTIEEILNITI